MGTSSTDHDLQFSVEFGEENEEFDEESEDLKTPKRSFPRVPHIDSSFTLRVN